MKKLPQRRKEKLFRLLSGIVVVPGLIGLSTMWVTFTVARVWMQLRSPPIDPEGWPQVAWLLAAGLLAYVTVTLSGFVLLLRRFLNYRTQKHGRRVALGDVLKPTDDRPGFLRILKLRLLGVRRDELRFAAELATK